MKKKSKKKKKILGINKGELKYILIAGIPGGVIAILLSKISLFDALY